METKHGYQTLDLAYLLGEMETKLGYQKLDLAYLLDEMETGQTCCEETLSIPFWWSHFSILIII